MLRAVYGADSEHDARRTLAEFYDTARAADVPECDRLARTIRRWEHEVLAYYRTDGLSNGRTEAVNGLCKKVKRIGHGFRNPRNYRLRLLRHAAASPGKITRRDTTHTPPRRRDSPLGGVEPVIFYGVPGGVAVRPVTGRLDAFTERSLAPPKWGT